MFESSVNFKTIISDNDPNRLDGRGGFVNPPKSDPFESSAPAYRGTLYPESDWEELAALQEKNQSSPYHVHKDHVAIMNQKSTNYCWCFGSVAGVANRYAATGIEPVPVFSPASTACQIKSFRNEGGWGREACAGIQEFGIATTATWPNVSFDRSLPNNPKVRADSFRHNIVEFGDLGRYNFEAVMSCLLDPINPSPCTGGFSHWGHLVLLLQAVKVNGQWGVLFANSWGSSWGDDGYGVLLGDKANPTEAIRIGAIKPIGESPR